MGSLPALPDCDAVLAIDGAIHTVWLVANEDRRRDLRVVGGGAEGMESSGSSLGQLKD